MNKQELLRKACEGFSQAFLIEVIWGKENIKSSYRSMISKRLSGKIDFGILEIEKLETFFKLKKKEFEEVLK
ncbi:MAG: hypothetical protein EAZ97_11415 [Bacteroidetes bacterium]|nr:MAG: hypothetical protein EAZ97_11415 [Bacteroidota bacterium]